MEAQEINAAWARRCVADKQWVLHTRTLAIGIAEELFDGIASVYVSEINGEPVRAPTLRLNTGHVLLAEPNAFVELAPKEVQFYVLATSKLGDWMKGAITVGADQGIRPETGVTLIVALLRAQLHALEAMSGRPDEVIG